MKLTTKELVLTALFIAIGVILPQLFHLIGGDNAGKIFLPMHIPVFIAAMYLGVRSGVLVAVITLLISMLLLGMPTVPIGNIMFFELLVYALVAGYLSNNRNLNPYISFFVAKLLGMLTALLMVPIAINLFDLTLPPVYGKLAMFSIGIPGIILQIIIIPIIIIVINKYEQARSN